MATTKPSTRSVNKYAPLLWRVLLFATIFLVLSGLIGPRIIGGGIMYRYHFEVYGSVGKALLFGMVALGLLIQRAAKPVTLTRWKTYNLSWLALSAVSFGICWLSVSNLLSGTNTTYWAVMAHTTLIASVVLALGGCFGTANIRSIVKTYQKEILLATLLAVSFYIFLYVVYGLWQELAGLVLHSVRFLLNVIGLTAVIVPPRTLLLDKFGINIAQYCSGIESIALFTGLYTVVGLLDWPRLNKRAFFMLFPLGLIILFGFNIVRVFGLIVAGYYINPHIAFSLFHTYAGMLFFIIYSALFWKVCYKRMVVAL